MKSKKKSKLFGLDVEAEGRHDEVQKEVKAGWIGRLCRGKARKSPKRKSKHEKQKIQKISKSLKSC